MFLLEEARFPSEGNTPSFFGNLAVRESSLTHGFAPQPHDWFAFIGKRNFLITLGGKVEQEPCQRRFQFSARH